MAINQRLPKSVKDSRELNDAEEKFVEKVERDNYSALNEFQLIDEYLSIDQQSQLLKGRILLALRNKFPSNNEFGEFVEKHVGTICSDTRQSRTRYMNLARFFSGGREMDKISLSAAYEISAPVNAEIAIEIYEYCRDKTMSVAEVKTLIAKKKGESLPLPEVIPPIEQKKDVIESNVPEKSKVEIIMTEVLAGLSKEEKSAILRECLRDINLYPSK